MVVIGEAKSGKTLSSVIAVVSSIIRQLQLDLFMPKTYGPKAIHLCCYSSDVRDVNGMYTSLLDGPDPDNVVSMACGAMSLEAAKAVIEGCDILITTPSCLVRILESMQKTELTRLRHIVFDDADVIFNVFPNEVETIQQIGQANTEIQTIILSKKWKGNFMHTMHNDAYSVYVSSRNQQESIFYSRAIINFEFFKPGHKNECLRALFMDTDSYQRSVVFCKNSDQIIYLQEKLEDIPTINLLVVHDEMSVLEVSDVGKEWRNSSLNPVLLCTDGLVFSELRLTSCTRLIHYSLPTQDDTFSHRFGCQMKSYRNIFLYEEENKEAPRIDILIDKTNDEPSPMIVNLMNRVKVHPVMNEVEQRLVRRKDISRKHAPVCHLLCKFGVCMEQKDACLHRHIFIKCVDDVDDYEKLLKTPE
ncbi:probable ATP-dependent RNA helicase DDX4 [Nilaparvata lugens]|uniref:probable ATP-dependent RNA helicase DDX4 n=1 Tax=Nilaparvata lugens TaxID=108931 RepID=UPI00193E2E46|nr:probable ATP-dependent RNA helicase DDX4 [Nilaparvata lugens]